MDGKSGRGRLQGRWKETKESLMRKELSEREGIVLVRDWETWGRLVHESG